MLLWRSVAVTVASGIRSYSRIRDSSFVTPIDKAMTSRLFILVAYRYPAFTELLHCRIVRSDSSLSCELQLRACGMRPWSHHLCLRRRSRSAVQVIAQWRLATRTFIRCCLTNIGHSLFLLTFPCLPLITSNCCYVFAR